MPNRKENFDQPIQVQSNRKATADLSGLSSLPYTPSLTGGMQFPFSTGSNFGGANILYTNPVGGFWQVFLTLFCAGCPRSNATLIANSQAFPILGGQFTLDSNVYQNYFTSFPCDIIVQGIEFCVTTGASFTPTGTTFGCVAIATASPTSSGFQTFTINQASQTSAKFPFIKSGNEGGGVTYAGEKTGLSIRIPAGTLFGVICGMYTTDGTMSISTINLNYSGSVLYTIDL